MSAAVAAVRQHLDRAEVVWSDPKGEGKLHLFPMGRGRFPGSVAWHFKASACKRVSVPDEADLPAPTSKTAWRCRNCRRYAYRAGFL